ncbi:Rpn family recombination-promoting nuclease/putative transposase [Nostoc sp. FACHB-973]|nr:Rpn family recombination-promoting nuclease/putative transposase [Nostoc sp. FACHB-973]
MAYDNICRYLAAEYPKAFVNWLFDSDAQGINAIQILPSELNLEPIRSDALYLLPESNKILHLEFQTVPASKPPLPLRMLDYWVRLYRQYNCPIEQVVIFLKETTSEAVYIDRFAVGRTFHSYRVVRIWEQDPSLLLTNPGLLPLAVLAQTDSPTSLLEQVAARIDMIEEADRQRNISACVEVLARLKFEQNLVRQFLREDLMRESPLYQEILQEGVQQGIQQGIQQGEVSLALRLLTRRLGTVPSQLQAQIQQLSTSEVEALGEALLDFSTTQDLAAWLQADQ